MKTLKTAKIKPTARITKHENILASVQADAEYSRKLSLIFTQGEQVDRRAIKRIIDAFVANIDRSKRGAR